MKARLKETGEFIDVEPNLSYDGCWLYSFYSINTHKTYSLWELDLTGMGFKYSDGQKRYEIAKSVLPHIVKNTGKDTGFITIKNNVENAIQYADELMKKLNEKK